jgi:hypothetical protein
MPARAFSFSRSRILLTPVELAAALPAAIEPSDIVHRSSNPPPLDFVKDAAAEEVGPALKGGFIADRGDAGPITAVAVYAGVAGVELGRTCGEDGESRLLNAAKAWGCVGWAGIYVAEEVVGLVDARRSMRFGLARAVTGAAANGMAVVVAVTGGEGGAA